MWGWCGAWGISSRGKWTNRHTYTYTQSLGCCRETGAEVLSKNSWEKEETTCPDSLRGQHLLPAAQSCFMKQHTGLILSTGTSRILQTSLLPQHESLERSVCVPTCTCTHTHTPSHTHAQGRTRKKLKFDWDLWEAIFFLNHYREELTVSVVHPSGTECLGIQRGPWNPVKENNRK